MSFAFDAQYYLNQNPDVLAAAAAGLTTAETHFNTFGWKELRNPNAVFNTAQYLTSNSDVLSAGMNPLTHFLIHGAAENRAPSTAYAIIATSFDSANYRSNNPDVDAAITAGSFTSAYQHWVLFGQYETGRPTAQLTDGTLVTAVATTGTTSGQTFTLTTGTDAGSAFTGTTAADTFDASGFFNSGTAALVQTLGNADSLDGGAGIDTLNALITTDVTPAALKNMEVINGTFTVAKDFNLANATGVTTIGSINSSKSATFVNVQSAPTNFTMTNTGEDMSVTMATAALAGTNDAATLTLNAVTGGTVLLAVNSGTNSYETITVHSAGATANTLTELDDGVATSFATLNVTGAQNLTITNALAAQVTTVDANAFTGKLNVTLGAAVHTVTGGSGDDTFVFGGNFVGAENATVSSRDTVNGGAGRDTLSMASAQAVAASAAAQTTVSNIEIIKVSDAVGGSINLTKFAGADTLSFGHATVGAHTFTLSTGNTVEFITGDSGNNARTFAIAGTGTSDSLTLKAVAATDLGTAEQTFSGVEVLNINTGTTAGAAVEVGGALTMTPTAGGASKVVVTGVNSLDLNGAVTANEIDASGLSGNAILDMTGSSLAAAGKVTGGSKNDIITGSTGNDILIGGAGNDTINIGAGNDVVTGGDGADNFVFIDASDDTTNDAGSNTITDFSFGANSDTLTFDVSGLGGLNGGAADPVLAGNYYEGAISGMTAGTAYAVIVVTDTGYADFDLAEQALSAQSGSATDGLFLFFNTTTNRAELYVDSDLSADNNIIAGDLIVTFDNVTTLAGMTQFSNTDFIFVA